MTTFSSQDLKTSNYNLRIKFLRTIGDLSLGKDR